ncbi:mannose-1-phosphate guanyltransferase alpha-A [Nilaparvata lugens]|uniref:mannose-1-phosphate guanyltransferase alpha-A n=1 Tax=Nilaparvata lugens TaxID=108931 RepID=UPI000B999CEC|nr:mannose-1-phosphate guanyltransferase alpha-A [Nilaparvata lugens]
MLKAVILVGGPSKGTRFRPLSLDIPKPLFPVAGLPIIQHHIRACVSVKGLKEILLIGYYPAKDLQEFIQSMIQEYKINIRYLQEFMALGTAGGMYHFRDQIRSGNPEAFFVMNGDVCADFPLVEMLSFHKCRPQNALITVMATEATRQQACNYGCIVMDKETHEITHYVEKPSTFVSTLVNCGVYVFSLEIFQIMAEIFNRKNQEYYNCEEVMNGSAEESGRIRLEQEVLGPLAATGRAFVMHTTKWWSQLKTAGAAIYANRHYLQLYKSLNPELLKTDTQATTLPDVYIHPTADVHSTAVLGPNVSIAANAVIGPGARIKESIVLEAAVIGDHSLVLHSIIGRRSQIGAWSRVEGTPNDPNPNKPFAKMDNSPLFNKLGRLNPSITIVGCSVTVPDEIVLLNSIVLPYKELTRSFKNEIIL